MRVMDIVKQHGVSGRLRNLCNDLVRLRRDIRSLAPHLQCNGGGHDKLACLTGWIEGHIAK